MENHSHLYLPPQAPTLAYTWDLPFPPLDGQLSSGCGGGGDEEYASTSELRQALLRALAELDAARTAHQAELRRMELEAARLAALVAAAAAERDELRRHCHSLLLLLHHQHQHQQLATPPANPLQNGILGGAVEELDVADETETAARPLPEKGRLVEAVVSAGPLLQTLLLAGPLPRWRHPPPPAPAGGADIPPFNPRKDAEAGNSLSSASASSSPESNCSGGPMLPYYNNNVSSFCM